MVTFALKVAKLASDPNTRFGHAGQMRSRLLELILARDMHPADLARSTRTDPSTLSKLINGRRRLGEHWARLFSPHLGVPVSAFYEDIGSPIPPLAQAPAGAPPEVIVEMAADAPPATNDQRESVPAEALISPGCGARIAAIRQALGFRTAAAFSARLGVSPRTVERWEADEEPPGLADITRMHELTISSDYILFGDPRGITPPLMERLIETGFGAWASDPAAAAAARHRRRGQSKQAGRSHARPRRNPSD